MEGNQDELKESLLPAEAPQPGQPRQVAFGKYFTYLTPQDRHLLWFGTLAAVLAGAILPSISLVMGNVAAIFSGDPNQPTSNILQTMAIISIIVSLIALSLFGFSYVLYAFWSHLAQNITIDLRKRYIEALMHQEIAYFETNKVEQIPAQIAEIFDTVQSSIGDKIANLIFACAACIAGFVYAFVYGWLYALVCIAYLPFFLMILGVFGMAVKKSTIAKLDAIKALGGIVEETLTAIKVVASFSKEDREIEKFIACSKQTSEVAKKQSETYALMVALMKFSIFLFYVYALFIGSIFIERGFMNGNTPYNFQTVIQTVIALITGFVSLISAMPNIQAIMAAKTLGVLIFDVIERQPLVANIKSPIQKVSLVQSINFTNVTFKYPTSLPEHKPVLIDATFSIKAGQATAVVGPSGSGKSTIVQLIERFYDPRSGTVDFDGQDIKSIDLKSLRENIGYVSQEPVMIMGTIRDNLMYGNSDATEEDCKEALRQANAAFVSDQESGLDTFVGTAGIMNMSGGQKQRIAIARALIKKPKILILDEATSALDPKSEVEVQAAIDKIAKSGSGLTIIIIAHRLTTIESADNLLYFKSRSELVTAAKGTPEYSEIFEKLKSISYAQGQDEGSDQEIEEIEEDVDGENMEDSGDEIHPIHASLNEELQKQPPASVPVFKESSSNVLGGYQSASYTASRPRTGSYRPISQQQKIRSHMSTRSGLSNSLIDQLDHLEQSQNNQSFYREVTNNEIMDYYEPKWLAYAGFTASVFASLSLPLFGLVLSKYIFTLAMYGNPMYTIEQITSERNKWTYAFLALCFGIGFASYFQKWLFGRGGENLTLKLRIKLFTSYMSKHIGWFDNKTRAPGILTNILLEDISAVNGLTTETISIAVEAALGLIFSCLICCIFSWQLALIVTVTTPLMVLGGYWQQKYQLNPQQANDTYKQANALLNDLIMNYRTVISFGDKNVQFMLGKYAQMLEVTHTSNVKTSHVSGLFFGYSQSIKFVYIGFVFFIAALFVSKFGLDSQRVFTGCYVVFVGAIGSGVSLSNIPSVSKAKLAAQTVFGIIESKSKIDPKQPGVEQMLSGCIEFRNIYFRYPSRQKYVLKGFNLRIEPNQSVAIVGHSGSGKSTIASLLLRFYDATQGSVCLDGVDIKDHDLFHLRQQISIVQQEPMLFNETIKQNIKFGDLNASDQRVKEAAVQANALAFIMQSDEDYTNIDVQSRLQDKFKSLTKLTGMANLQTMLQLCQQGNLDYKALMFMIQMTANLSSKGIKFLDDNFQNLLLSFKQQMVKSDCTWQRIFKACDYQQEATLIRKYLSQSNLLIDQKLEVEIMLVSNECQFDLAVVTQFQGDSSFSTFMRSERARVEMYYEQRLESFVDVQEEIQLDPGFEKMCGLKGSKLSGGQKQRIAIARALIKSPKIMILDEATSALDEQSQEIVQQALDRAMEGRTSVVIAHRMTTIKKCNRIVVLHRGKVVEDGTYEELTSIKDGHFARLEKGIA